MTIAGSRVEVIQTRLDAADARSTISRLHPSPASAMNTSTAPRCARTLTSPESPARLRALRRSRRSGS